MSRFVFRLEKLLQLRIQQRHQRRTELARAFEADRVLQQDQQDLASEFQRNRGLSRDAAAPTRVQPQGARGQPQGASGLADELLEIHRYELVLLGRQHELHQQMDKVRLEIARRRSALVEADRQVRILDKLKQQQWRIHQADADRAEQREADDMVLRQRRFSLSEAFDEGGGGAG